MKFTFCSLILALVCAAGANRAAAQGTAFTYQGRLNNGGNFVTGSFDFTLTLYNTNLNGVPVAGPVTNTAIGVTNSLFTMTADFGPGVFNGAVYWLEIGARTNGGGGFSILAPRQPIMPTPYAIYAESANAANLAGDIADTNLPPNVALLDGNQTFTGRDSFGAPVAVNVASTTTPLQISDTVQLAERIRLSGTEFYTGTFYDTNGVSLLLGVNRVNNRQLWIGDSAALTVNSTNTVCRITPSTTQVAIDAMATDGLTPKPMLLGNALSITTSGYVGIGTNAPVSPLHINTSSYLPATLQSSSGTGTWLDLYNTSAGGTDWHFISVGAASQLGPGNLVIAAAPPGFLGNPVVSVTPGGNVGIEAINPTALLQVQSATCDGTTWQNACDRALKENFSPVTPGEVLAKVAALPISQWNYKRDQTAKHLGPTAQDFRGAFALGTDDKHISTVDEGGVALAAIQGLNQKVESENLALRAENAELRQRLDALEKIVLGQKPSRHE